MDKEERQSGDISRLLGGLLLGGVAMYLLDPEKGRRRRAMLRDQLIHLGRQVQRCSGVVAADMLNRSKGLIAETRSAIRREKVPDEVLRERVRAALGRAVSHPRSVDVDVQDGKVTLKGFILEEEVPPMLAMIGTVRGVREIEDKMERGRHPEEMPSLQGGRPRKAWKPDLFQSNQAPSTRFLLGLGGAALVRNGMRHGGFLGTLANVGGSLMLTRAITNMDMSRLLGISEQEVTQVNKTIEIDAPVEEVYNFWRYLENFPKFMEGLMDVQILDDLRSRWIAKGPMGIPAQWTAKITKIEPNKRISWSSEHGSGVINSGHVYFQQANGDRTRIQVHIAYAPPLGGLGHAVASIFLADPKHRLDSDLIRLKSIIEDGKTSAKGEEVTREEVERVTKQVPLDKPLHALQPQVQPQQAVAQSRETKYAQVPVEEVEEEEETIVRTPPEE